MHAFSRLDRQVAASPSRGFSLSQPDSVVHCWQMILWRRNIPLQHTSSSMIVWRSHTRSVLVSYTKRRRTSSPLRLSTNPGPDATHNVKPYFASQLVLARFTKLTAVFSSHFPQTITGIDLGSWTLVVGVLRVIRCFQSIISAFRLFISCSWLIRRV